MEEDISNYLPTAMFLGTTCTSNRPEFTSENSKI